MEYHLIKNVLTKDQRKYMIKESIPLLKSWKGREGLIFPGKQTGATLYSNPKFEPFINRMLELVYKRTGLVLEVSKSWVNWTNGSKKDIAWHSHPCEYSLVYYMKTPLPFFSNGTLFRSGLFKAPHNSMIIFPGDREHTAPSSPFRFGRYSLAMELNMGNRALT